MLWRGLQASTYQVIDEYGQIQPSGSVPLVNGGYSFTVSLQASRRGNDQDGRHYKQNPQNSRRNALPTERINGPLVMCHEHLTCALIELMQIT
jgi:hypothetical protein